MRRPGCGAASPLSETNPLADSLNILEQRHPPPVPGDSESVAGWHSGKSQPPRPASFSKASPQSKGPILGRCCLQSDWQDAPHLLGTRLLRPFVARERPSCQTTCLPSCLRICYFENPRAPTSG